MERIHSFLKQYPDNASEIANPAELDLERSIESLLADDSDDIRDDTFEESFSDQCDIAKELKNQDEKQASIDSETSTKHDESNTIEVKKFT